MIFHNTLMHSSSQIAALAEYDSVNVANIKSTELFQESSMCKNDVVECFFHLIYVLAFACECLCVCIFFSLFFFFCVSQK